MQIPYGPYHFPEFFICPILKTMTWIFLVRRCNALPSQKALVYICTSPLSCVCGTITTTHSLLPFSLIALRIHGTSSSSPSFNACSVPST
ncbi:hypothetical protein BDQ12DRAFT_681611 [Crucibulum laeve]|uniref:Uncharacterized protein n=1 Tax=Crucibulum laeve TaxID=68775 RepID=A0A5C3M3M1_9AGAR|nr:hypothetical protein BDQ12DRAFT_681611 [Crucibulum laeve]